MRTVMTSYKKLDSLPDFCTLADLSEVFQVSKATLYRMAGQGRLPCIRLGRRVIISREHLKKWIDREIGAEAENRWIGVS